MKDILTQYKDKINGIFSFFDRMIITGHLRSFFQCNALLFKLPECPAERLWQLCAGHNGQHQSLCEEIYGFPVPAFGISGLPKDVQGTDRLEMPWGLSGNRRPGLHNLSG